MGAFVAILFVLLWYQAIVATQYDWIIFLFLLAMPGEYHIAPIVINKYKRKKKGLFC